MSSFARLFLQTTRATSQLQSRSLHLNIQRCRSHVLTELFQQPRCYSYARPSSSSWLGNRRYLNTPTGGNASNDVGAKEVSASSPILKQQQQRRQRFQNRDEMYKAKNRALLMYSAAVVVAALGVTYAAVPLYRMFCAATGFAGTPNVGTGRFDPERLVPVEEARRIKVHFNADRSEQLPWSFKPQQKFVSVLPGETSLAFYTAKNDSKQDIIGIATYNVTPDRVAPYFSKVECFCFEEQKLLAGEEVDMPLLFFIDKDILDDPSCRNVDSVVLSYTFFRARRNRYGQLEPDAGEDEVQESLGFGQYEHAPKVEDRGEKPST
ncbi:hypothetical protein L218DRAFT_955051 [Marasmius fiardii PR-910]|nr:hypothetical protein L218DRAFT_955051 [Marasmius fiardii PR-910]